MTTRQMQVLRSIQTYTEEHGHPPSIRDLQDRLGDSSSSVTAYWINKCLTVGYLETCEKCPPTTTRSLRLTVGGLAMLKVAV